MDGAKSGFILASLTQRSFRDDSKSVVLSSTENMFLGVAFC